MSAKELSRQQREELCDLLEEHGPDAPTLCEGWTTRDLAAHLVIREGRPDASLGILGGPLAAWTERVQNGAASEPYEKLIRLLRNGPPIWSAFRLPLVDGQVNSVEYFVHLEDIRRAQPGWKPRELPPQLQDLLWDRLKTAGRMLLRDAGVGVRAHRTDTGEEARLRGGDPCVTLLGTPAEIMMLAYGRQEHEATIEGEDEAVALFTQAKLGG